jgi:folate-binding protein YgfZ
MEYRNSPIFIDSRNKKLGARILSTLEKLHLTIKKLELKIVKPEIYFNDAHALGVPVKGVEILKEQLFGLEANFEELKAIDFKKGCYIGQENTARMKLKNKLRRRLLPIKTQDNVKTGDELKFNNTTIGKVLIGGPTPFALVKLFDPDFTEFNNKEISINNKKAKLVNAFA